MNTIKKIILIAILLSAFIFIASDAFALNYPELKGIPDKVILKNSDSINEFVDLSDYSFDENQNPSDLKYELVGQTNARLVDCYLENDFFVSCDSPKRDSTGENKITVKVTNEFGLTDTDDFRIIVAEKIKAEGIVVEDDLTDCLDLETSDSMNITYTVQNNFNERKCFDIETYLDHDERDDIKAVTTDGFCLNANEKTSFTVTVTSFDDARVDNYDLDVLIHYDNETIEENVCVNVIDYDEPIDVYRTSDYFICKEPYTQEISVRLENNSNSTQRIELSAAHDLLMPMFEYSTTILNRGEHDEMVLRFHTNGTTANTEYTIPVFARSEDYYVQRDITFRLVECETNEFDLSVTPNKIKMERGEEDEFRVTLRSYSDEDQYVRLSVESDIPAKLDEYYVLLPANGLYRIDLTVEARDTDTDGTHDVKINAWNNNETEDETVEVEIEGQHGIEIEVFNNDFEARICSATSSQIFEVVVKNTGDFDETVELSIDNDYDYIQTVLSEDEVDVKDGETKTIYVFVNPSYTAELGEHTIYITAETDDDEVTEELRFKIVESDEVEFNVIEVIGYPTNIEVQPGKDTKVSFTIRNPLNEDIENVNVAIYGVTGYGLEVMPLRIGDLKAGETLTFTRILSADKDAPEKIYNATLEIRGNGYITTKNMKIIVTNTPSEEPKNEDKNGVLSGFLTLLTPDSMGFAGMFLIVLVAIIVILSLLNSNKSESYVYNRGV